MQVLVACVLWGLPAQLYACFFHELVVFWYVDGQSLQQVAGGISILGDL